MFLIQRYFLIVDTFLFAKFYGILVVIICYSAAPAVVGQVRKFVVSMSMLNQSHNLLEVNNF